jgi:hypothetical protein
MEHVNLDGGIRPMSQFRFWFALWFGMAVGLSARAAFADPTFNAVGSVPGFGCQPGTPSAAALAQAQTDAARWAELQCRGIEHPDPRRHATQVSDWQQTPRCETIRTFGGLVRVDELDVSAEFDCVGSGS